MNLKRNVLGFLLGFPTGLIIGFAGALYFLFSGGTFVSPSPREVNVRAQIKVTEEDVRALALTIYHETRGIRGPDDIGYRAVASVVFNRLDDPRFPKSIPEVVYQLGPGKGTCAFSWYCDGIPDEPKDKRLYREIWKIAYHYLLEYREGMWHDPTVGSHSYHSVRIPANQYFERLRPIGVIEKQTPEGPHGHIFYKDRG